jgi:hypothetical protein
MTSRGIQTGSEIQTTSSKIKVAAGYSHTPAGKKTSSRIQLADGYRQAPKYNKTHGTSICGIQAGPGY